MYLASKRLGLAIAAASMIATAPAAAQYQRRESVAEQIAREIREAAAAAATVSDAVRDAVHGYRFRSPGERFAVEACGARASRYGRVRVDHVSPYKSRSWRVTGTADPGAGYRYGRREVRGFTCTVREDGRITKFKTKRLRYY